MVYFKQITISNIYLLLFVLDRDSKSTSRTDLFADQDARHLQDNQGSGNVPYVFKFSGTFWTITENMGNLLIYSWGMLHVVIFPSSYFSISIFLYQWKDQWFYWWAMLHVIILTCRYFSISIQGNISDFIDGLCFMLTC